MVASNSVGIEDATKIRSHRTDIFRSKSCVLITHFAEKIRTSLTPHLLGGNQNTTRPFTLPCNPSAVLIISIEC